jgi:hypothetical protein
MDNITQYHDGDFIPVSRLSTRVWWRNDTVFNMQPMDAQVNNSNLDIVNRDA